MTGIVARLHAATRGPQPPGLLLTLTVEEARELLRLLDATDIESEQDE